MRFRKRIILPLAATAFAVVLGVSFWLSKASNNPPMSGPQTGAEQSKPAGYQGQDNFSSLRELADSVASRAARRDTAALIRLMADDSAFRRYVWPVSGNYDPGRMEVFDFVWTMHLSNSAKGMVRLIHDMEGADSALKRRALETKTIPGAEGAEIHEWASPDGIRLFASALETEGVFQVYSFSGAGSAVTSRFSETGSDPD